MSAIQRGWLAWTQLLWSLTRAFSWVSGLAILMTIAVTLREVIGRYWFDAPAPYAYTLVSVSVVVILYFSLAYTATIDGHVSSDEFYSKFPPRLQNFVLLLSDITAAVIGLLLATQTWAHLRRSLATNEVLPDLFRLPLAIPQSFVVLGSVLLVLVAVTKMPYHVADIFTGRKSVIGAHDPAEAEQ